MPFLQPLLARLSELLQHGSRKTQEMCVSAIASVAMAAADQFTPYFAQVYGLMRVLLGQTGEQALLALTLTLAPSPTPPLALTLTLTPHPSPITPSRSCCCARVRWSASA